MAAGYSFINIKWLISLILYVIVKKAVLLSVMTVTQWPISKSDNEKNIYYRIPFCRF